MYTNLPIRCALVICVCVCVWDRSLICCVIACSSLCACLTFCNCIITRSVPSCKKRAHCNLQHMLQAVRLLPLITDLGGMASSSGCLDSPQHVGRHMLLWVNLIDWMAPNSQVQVSSGSQRVNLSKWRMSLGVGCSPNRLAWTSSHMPLVSPSDISGFKLATLQGAKWHCLDHCWLEMWGLSGTKLFLQFYSDYVSADRKILTLPLS